MMTNKPLEKINFLKDSRLLFVSKLQTLTRQTPSHSHPEGQLFYNISGKMLAECDQMQWVIPSTRALWVPPNMPHSGISLSPVHIHSIYVNPGVSLSKTDMEKPKLLFVGSLLRELIKTASTFPDDRECSRTQKNILTVIFDQLCESVPEPGLFPVAKDKRLIKATRLLHTLPGESGLDEISKKSGASTATLKRLFQSELGLSFTDYRKQVRILAALPLISSGESALNVALEVGYESSSAFSKAFKSVMGISIPEFKKRS